MSQTRPIWNDGQGLATPDLQRGSDLVGNVDDRVHETNLFPGVIPKRVIPLLEEFGGFTTPPTGAWSNTGANPNSFVGQLPFAQPSTSTLSPVGTNGAVRVAPATYVVGSIAGNENATRQISLAATAYTFLDSALITSNVSGSIRYDLIYATVNRAVTVSATRKIKSATDGSLSSPSVNLADSPQVTLGTVVGFLTGATAPTLAQIYAALPADTAPSSSTFGSFNFPVAYVTVANGYTSGTTLAFDSSSGSTYINQTVPLAWTRNVRGVRPMSIYYGAANELATNANLSRGVPGAERWGNIRTFFSHFKLLTSTATSPPGTTIDTTIDWRRRFVWGFWSWLGSPATSFLPIEGLSAGVNGTVPTVSGASVLSSGVVNPWYTGGSTNTSTGAMLYSTTSSGMTLTVNGSTGALSVSRGSVVNASGDLMCVVLYATDQFFFSA